MKIPEDPVVWIFLIVVAGLVVALALWLGRGMIFRRDKQGVSFEIKAAPATRNAKETDISVAKNAVIDDVTAEDITGAKTEGADADVVNGKKISVLDRAKVSGSKVGDIAGIKITKK